MKKYRLTPEASRDLEGIGDYIAEDNPAVAVRVVDAIEEKCRALAQMPEMGRVREELAPGLCNFTAGKYLIFYRPTDDGIQVIRIAHGSQDLPSLFER
jgi:toxin ParE1/3/4